MLNCCVASPFPLFLWLIGLLSISHCVFLCWFFFFSEQRAKREGKVVLFAYFHHFSSIALLLLFWTIATFVSFGFAGLPASEQSVIASLCSRICSDNKCDTAFGGSWLGCNASSICSNWSGIICDSSASSVVAM